MGVEMERYLTNAAINKMKKDEIVEALCALKLNSRGNKEEVSKRLKSYWKRRRQADKNGTKRSYQVADRYFDFLCVIDFECTCENRNNPPSYPHEIIEFPAVLLRTATLEVVAEFHSFCRPSINPKLSRFCTELTGITQEQVDAAPSFIDVFEDFKAFLEKYELETTYRVAFVTDGSADFGTFLQLQCHYCSIPVPHSMRYWINIRRPFRQFTGQNRATLSVMLQHLGMEFTGRMHSGLDDARNIARVAAHLLKSRCELLINERLLRKDKLAIAGKNGELAVRNNFNPIVENNRTIGTSADGQNGRNGANLLQEDDDGPVSSQCSIDDRNDEAGIRAQSAPGPQVPYLTFHVSKHEFLANTYESCFTCSEDEDKDV